METHTMLISHPTPNPQTLREWILANRDITTDCLAQAGYKGAKYADEPENGVLFIEARKPGVPGVVLTVKVTGDSWTYVPGSARDCMAAYRDIRSLRARGAK